MTEVDFTTAEIATELKRIQSRIGPVANVAIGLSISDYGDAKPYGHCSPKGVARGDTFYVKGETWREVIGNLEARWNEQQETYEAETIRRMALAVIDITNRLGECSDAALRGDGFNRTEVERFGATACTMATDMAAGGPFAIIQHAANANELREAA